MSPADERISPWDGAQDDHGGSLFRGTLPREAASVLGDWHGLVLIPISWKHRLFRALASMSLIAFHKTIRPTAVNVYLFLHRFVRKILPQ